MSKEFTQLEINNFTRWRDDLGFDTTNPHWINARNSHNMTPLHAAVLVFQSGDARAAEILENLLLLGADPALDVPHNPDATMLQQDVFGGNAISFAAAKGCGDACAIMYKHNPDVINAPTGPDSILNAFAASAFQLDNDMPDGAELRDVEVARKEACENLIRLFVKEMGYDVNTPLPGGELPIECLVMNNRPLATKLFIELGANIGLDRNKNILQLAAMTGADKILPVIKEHCPALFSVAQEDISAEPLILAMLRAQGQRQETELQYKNVIQFIAQEKYSNGMGIIDVLNIAVLNDLLIGRNALVDIWATKFDALAGKTPLMWAVENVKHPGCKDLVTYISKFPEEIRDQMPEFGKGLLTLDDDHMNMYYPQYVLHGDQRCGGVAKVLEAVPDVTNRAPYSEPTGVVGKQNHPALGPSKIVHKNMDIFNYACEHGEIEIAQNLSANPNLGTFNNNFRQDHIHYAVRFGNVKTVHNIAAKEVGTISNVDSFDQDPLSYAADRWCRAQEAADKDIAKHIIAEVVFHGGVDLVRARARVDFHDEDVVAFEDIIHHAADIHDAFLVGDVAAELADLEVTA